ncbi:MAG TPA: ABC transporter permease [Oscillatoriaceae cyanobacterium]
MAITQILGATGRGTLSLLASLGQMGTFAGRTLRWLTRFPYLEGVLQQAARVGVQSLAVVCCIQFFVGANIALVGDSIFRQFGGQNLLGIYVGMTSVIGMAPMLVGALLCAKPGTEITATIASMRVKEQIDALEVMAVNPFWYLIIPRFLAFLLVTPALTVFSYLASVGGGFAAAVFQLGNNPGTFLSDVVRFLTLNDLFNGIWRAEIFALDICLVSCFFGYFSRPGPAGVSRAINLAVVIGSTSIIVINYFLTQVMY